MCHRCLRPTDTPSGWSANRYTLRLVTRIHCRPLRDARILPGRRCEPSWCSRELATAVHFDCTFSHPIHSQSRLTHRSVDRRHSSPVVPRPPLLLLCPRRARAVRQSLPLALTAWAVGRSARPSPGLEGGACASGAVAGTRTRILAVVTPFSSDGRFSASAVMEKSARMYGVAIECEREAYARGGVE